MERKNDFIAKGHFPKSFELWFDTYKKEMEVISSLRDEKIEDKDDDFKNRYDNYRLIHHLKKKKDGKYLDIDLKRLENDFLKANPDIEDFISIKDRVDALRKHKNEILTDIVTFDFMGGCDKHLFKEEDGNLTCAICGVSTKDYDLTKEEVEFLKSASKKQMLLIEDYKKEDKYLLENLIDELYKERKEKSILDSNDPNYMNKLEEYFLSEETESLELKLKLRSAHKADENFRKLDFDYLGLLQKAMRLKDIEEARKKINPASRFKDLLEEECDTAKFEVLLLSGEHIPTLFASLEEKEKSAFIKAYYHLSNLDFRLNSGYFSTRMDAIRYDYITANPEIHERIRLMKK